MVNLQFRRSNLAGNVLCALVLFLMAIPQSQSQVARESAEADFVVGLALSETDDGVDEPDIIDGDGGTGFLILDGVTQLGNSDNQSIYTNFYTEGGAGSGGGAGLGGTFFVNEGATLILENVSLVSNGVKGGEGGSAPAVSIDEIGVGLRDQETSVGSLTAFQIVPTFEFIDGQYIITGYEMTAENALVVEGNTVLIDGAMDSTNIASVSGSTVTLSEGVALSGDNVTALSNGVLQEDGVTISIAPPSDPMDNDPFGSLAGGEILIGDGIAAGTVVESVTRNSDGFVTSITTNQQASELGMPGAPLAISADILSVRSAESAQFFVDADDTSGRTIVINNPSAFGLQVGMTLSGEGIPEGTVIESLDGDNVVLSQVIDAVSFEAMAPAIYNEGTTIRLSSPDPRLVVGMQVEVAGELRTIVDVLSNGDLVVDSAIDVSIPDEGILLSSSQVTGQSGNTLTVVNADGLHVGMEVSGSGIPEGATITAVSGNQVTLSATDGTVTALRAVDPLSTGGSMNGIAETGSRGANGENGIDARVGSAFLNEGEGLPGTNGLGGDDGEGAAGGDGGNGGDGSDGMPFNYQLVKEIIDTTFAAAFETAEATSNFATFPPAGAEAAVHFAAAILEYVNLAEGIANLVLWNIDLANGSVGLGGAGGDGGEGGGGDEFYGGGAGGDGGNAGSGALAVTTGEDGGNGARGGAGGFGAGGGSGGAGGDAGDQGRAADGDPGDGGDAGFGAGEGSRGDGLYGGGGSGFGGAIFVRDGGSLIIQGNALLENNVALAGSSNNRGEAGESAGSDLFIMRGADVLLAPGAGNTITIRGSIADDSQGTYDSASWAAGDGADLRIGGGGLVVLEGENTYTGSTIIQGASLRAEDGVGIHEDSHILFNGSGTIDGLEAHNNTGTLLAEGEVVRRVSTLPSAVSWDGAGGYTASSEEGLVLNFGKITDSLGQTLVWDSASITADSVMTFGGEFGLGSVDLINDINLNASTANIAVFDSALTDSDSATLSGVLYGGSLNVGGAGFDGTLYLTGQNDLVNLTINNGTTSTVGGGRISDLDGAGVNVTVNGGDLYLEGAERLSSVTIAENGAMTTAGEINAGEVTVTGLLDSRGSATHQSLTIDSAGQVIVNADMTVSGVLTNAVGGVLNQNADMTASSAVNDGQWNVNATSTDATHDLTVGGLTGSGVFTLTTDEVGTGNLNIVQSGDSLFAGVIEGAGVVEKSGAGALTVSGAHTFTGGLDVTGGTFVTAAGFGTLADTVAVTIADTAVFEARNDDTVGSFAVADGGSLSMYADLTTQSGVELNGLLTSFTADTLTMGTGLTGAGSGILDVGADGFVLSQAGDTTYSGSITGAGSLVKLGDGTLTLDGVADSVDVAGTYQISAGGIVAGATEVLSDDLAVEVDGTGQLVIATVQTIDTLDNTASVVVDAQLNVASVLTNAVGGVLNQNADMTASSAVNDGQWNVNATSTDATHDLTVGGLTGSGVFTLTTDEVGTGNLNIVQSGDSLFAGVIEGAGVVEKSGAGALTVSGAHTFTGGLDVTGGTFVTAAGFGTLADTVAVTIADTAVFEARNDDTVGSFAVADGGSLSMYADLTTQSGVELNGLLTSFTADTLTMGTGLTGAGSGILDVGADGFVLSQAGDTTYSGSITGAGSLVKLGDGTLTLDGVADSVDVAGTYQISAGGIVAGATEVLSDDLAVEVDGTGQLVIATVQTIDTLDNTASVVVDAQLNVASVLTNAVGGVLNQNADMTASSAVNDGQWNVNATSTDATHDLTVGGLTGSGVFTLTTDEVGTGNLNIVQSGDSLFAGVIEGAGVVEKSGAGALTVSGAHTFTGGLDVTGGTFVTAAGFGTLADTVAVTIADTAVFEARNDDTVGSFAVADGGSLSMYADLTTQSGVELNGLLTSFTADTLTMGTGLTGAGSGILDVGADGFVLSQAGDTTYSGSITGAGSLVKLGDGTLTLDGVADSVDVDGILRIDQGMIGLDGAFILNEELDVQIAEAGALALITGDQRIHSISGSGVIDLGSNALEIELGGSFFGEVLGNGTFNVMSGDFTASNSMTSTQGTFRTGTGAVTTIVAGTTLSFPEVELAAGGVLNVSGSVVASENITVEDNARLLLGDEVTGLSGSLTSPLVEVFGSLLGRGSIDGNLTVFDGGELDPGFSPGVISVSNLTLQSGSTTRMELAGLLMAGQDFDQLVISDTMLINDGAVLELNSLDGYELGAGDVARLFVTAPGSLQGTFGQVTSEFAGDVALNLSNGTVVGLGEGGLDGLATSVSNSANNSAILDAVVVANSGTAAQFRGGYLVERLAAAGQNQDALDIVFAQASPVTLGALLDQVKLSTFQTRIDLPRNASEASDSLAVTYGYDVNESVTKYALEDYELKRQAQSVQYNKAFDWGLVSVGVDAEQRDVRADYLTGETDGLSFNAAATYVLNDEISVSIDANWVDHDITSRRITSNGFATGDGIDATGLSAGITLSYDTKFDKTQVFSSIGLIGYDIEVDAFDEENRSSVLDSLQIRKQSSSKTAVQADLIVLHPVSEQLRIGGALKFTEFGGGDERVTANVTTEDVPFTVVNKGVGSQLIELGVTADYKPADRWSISVDAGFQGESRLEGAQAQIQLEYAL